MVDDKWQKGKNKVKKRVWGVNSYVALKGQKISYLGGVGIWSLVGDTDPLCVIANFPTYAEVHKFCRVISLEHETRSSS
jgi:hypothetical protein